ncbi:MAG TPA: DUF3105 domain-containing protein [Ktedonobacterales bacterium]|jgi:hypothetical protein|nr:DUF3105 domain-containing protein [Ktedonobacterales bacterium]
MSKSRGSATPQSQRRETRREQLQQRQQERQREQERQQRATRLRQVGLWGGGVAIVALIGFLIIHAITGAAATSAANGPIAGVVTYSNLSRNHKTGPLTYAQNPPVGGDHNPVWLNCGIYAQPVPTENAVHSMEHGAVWITYQPNLADSDIQKLRTLVGGHSYFILSPYNGLPVPVVASAWGVQLKVQSASDPRLAQFLQKYEQGPQTPEPGAACTGGVGTPTN